MITTKTFPGKSALFEADIYVRTARSFLDELAFLDSNIDETTDIFSLPRLKKNLLQLRESAEMLGLGVFKRPLDVLVASLNTKNYDNRRRIALEKLEAFKSELETRLEEISRLGIPPKPSLGLRLSGLRVLIAEDIKVSQAFIASILKKEGAVVKVAENGKDCIEKYYKQGPFDIIFMDIFMPVMTGLQATRDLRSKGETIPIIALTALASRDDRRECLEAGCTDYVTKPIKPELLIETCWKYAAGKNTAYVGENQEPYNVLVVTDNKTLQVFLSALLSKKGAVVRSTENADKALRLFIKDKAGWDLLVIDENLEHKNWSEFVRLIYSIKRDMKIVLLTDRTHLDTIQAAIKIGCEKVLPRPLRYEETAKILTSLMPGVLGRQPAAQDKGNITFTSSRHGLESMTQRIGCAFPCSKIAVFQRSFHEKGGDRVYCRRFTEHGKCGVIVADVAGHDNQSALAASWLTGILEGLWKYNQAPETLLQTLSQHVDTSADHEMNTRFLCLLVLLYDVPRQQLFYANAGIPSGYLVNMDDPRQSKLLTWGGTPVGLLPGVNNFQCGTIPFTHGHRLFIATDGIFESISEEVTTQIYDYVINKNLPDTLEKISDYFIRAIPKEDDLTIAVLEADKPWLPPNGKHWAIYSTYEAVDVVMKEIEGFLARDYRDNLDVFMVCLAIREVLLNAVEHGNQRIESRYIDIDLLPGDNILEVLVSDEGPGFDYHRLKKQAPEDTTASIQGRGIKVLEQTAAKIEAIGGSVRMIFSFNGQNSPTPNPVNTIDNTNT